MLNRSIWSDRLRCFWFFSAFFVIISCFNSTQLPEAGPVERDRGQKHKPRLVSSRHRNFTSARISGGSPHCMIRHCRAVAGLKYHYGLLGLLRYSPPWGCFPVGWVPLVTLIGCPLRRCTSAGGLGASPLSLFLTDRQLTYLCFWIFSFQSTREGIFYLLT